jgi:propanol-preferring alcohol dehydrogenase
LLSPANGYAWIVLPAMQAFDYERDLFYERELRTVTANTRVDGWEFLRMAGEIGIT